VALFGFMGVGKTAVGRALSERTGLEYVDLDSEIARRKGKTIPQIFEEEGEAGFRAVEMEVTREVAGRNGQVIACGGGAVLDPENVVNLKRSSVMVLLTAEPRVILGRVEEEGDVRPLLMVEDKLGRIQHLLNARLPRYLEVADLMLDTSEMTPEEAADEIINQLGEVDPA
jgi:shikimate kinase